MLVSLTELKSTKAISSWSTAPILHLRCPMTSDVVTIGLAASPAAVRVATVGELDLATATFRDCVGGWTLVDASIAIYLVYANAADEFVVSDAAAQDIVTLAST